MKIGAFGEDVTVELINVNEISGESRGNPNSVVRAINAWLAAHGECEVHGIDIVYDSGHPTHAMVAYKRSSK